MYYLSVAATFRNESHIFKEWLDHYIHHGVEHFYLVDDFSTDDYQKVIQPYISKNLITLVTSEDIPRGEGKKDGSRQILKYNKLLKYQHETQWLMIVDLDEFIYSPDCIDLKQKLKQFEQFSSIEVPVLYFGANYMISQPQSLVYSCKYRCDPFNYIWRDLRVQDSSGIYIQLVKSIIQFNTLEYFGVNNMGVRGEFLRIPFEDITKEPPFLLNHYYIQSKDHFCGRKFDFRDENGGGHTPDYNFWCMLYEDSERQMNCIEDTRLLQQNLPLLTESSLSS